ncbi:RluA family pseudouridine synthase [Dehalococcoidia bacterium]|nr:RluA family pseudouridine synthase [Dehalococcoidia bacterium]
MTKTHSLVATETGPRLDQFLAARLGTLTRSHLKKLIEDGHVKVSGNTPKPSTRLKIGDTISVIVPNPEPTTLIPQAMPLNVVHEDKDLLVIDKPAGLTVHPGPGHPDHTLVNAVLAHCPDLTGIKGTVRPGIVHRLDKETSGLIIVAKNDHSQTILSAQMKNREIHKHYLALVRGIVPFEFQAIDAPIGRDLQNRKRMAVTTNGRQAKTECRTVEKREAHTLLKCKLITGRTHQIRVHLASIGHPVIGDPIYGRKDPLLQRQFLHAASLCFQHPTTGLPIKCQAPLPPDLKALLEQLGFTIVP